MVEAMKNRDGSDVARYLGLATTRSILGQRQMCLRDRLQQGPEVVQFRGTVLQVDAEGIEALTRHDLGREPMGYGEPSQRHLFAVTPHLLDLARSHSHISSVVHVGALSVRSRGASERRAGVTSIALSDAPETMPGLCKPTYGENLNSFGSFYSALPCDLGIEL